MWFFKFSFSEGCDKSLRVPSPLPAAIFFCLSFASWRLNFFFRSLSFCLFFFFSSRLGRIGELGGGVTGVEQDADSETQWTTHFQSVVSLCNSYIKVIAYIWPKEPGEDVRSYRLLYVNHQSYRLLKTF